MKTIKVTNEELAVIKTALTFRIHEIEKEIQMNRENIGHIPRELLELKRQYETAFEALSFAN
ncbi:hypothetical protein [Parageobacillus thermoglucosidasius]|uniref:hypothetical protein n=1 Tax=Parageobacillus thermoglucosidasius TaxID=1426 RepID=UPI000B54F1A9|nr:hypothetical protein [Parageobacillus thermoglucosidasius]MBY6270291.1 hypothetical protein [Parageobacillus thermoglucosidasius]OUM83835.1 MAG: hypothetical protein BAA00_15805 [Parageobacillus thermoglucosidasius]